MVHISPTPYEVLPRQRREFGLQRRGLGEFEQGRSGGFESWRSHARRNLEQTINRIREQQIKQTTLLAERTERAIRYLITGSLE